MVTLVQNPFVDEKKKHGSGCSHDELPNGDPGRSYDGYVEPDTKIPPKARPVISEISVNGMPVAEATIMAEAQQHPADTPGEALLEAARALVIRELLLQEARKLKILASPEHGADGNLETEEDALIRQLIDHEVSAPVSDQSERRLYYDRHKDQFRSETIFEARHILLVDAEKGAGESKFNLARAIIDELDGNAGRFGKLAKEYSACPSSHEGGNLGQLTKGSTVPEFEEVLEKMHQGQIWPEPVKSRFGLHVIYLVNKIPGEMLPFEYVEDKIGAWLEASSWSKAVSQYISILAGKSDITGINLDGANSPLVQ
ncbi:MAG: peptidylprolyl isomerase [Rhizobiaceae bacterium]